MVSHMTRGVIKRGGAGIPALLILTPVSLVIVGTKKRITFVG